MGPVDTNYINTFSVNLRSTASLQIDKAAAYICRAVIDFVLEVTVVVVVVVLDEVEKLLLLLK